jgi:hypothetical protein
VLAVAAALCLPSTVRAQSLSVETELAADLNIGLWLAISLVAAVALLFAFKYAMSRLRRTWFGHKHIMGTKTDALLVPVVMVAVYASGHFPLSPGKPIVEVGSSTFAILHSLIWAAVGYCCYLLRNSLATFLGATKFLVIIFASLALQSHAVFERLSHFIDLDRLAVAAMYFSLIGGFILFILNRISTSSLQRT